MQIVGVTGISGAGKSTVSSKICSLVDAEVVDADRIAKDLSKTRRSILY